MEKHGGICVPIPPEREHGRCGGTATDQGLERPERQQTQEHRDRGQPRPLLREPGEQREGKLRHASPPAVRIYGDR